MLKHFFLSFIFLSTIIDYSYCEQFYSYNVENHEGEVVSLEKYKGLVTLVVNVASQCGYTDSSYRALTRLHDILSYDGYFSVLAFPCNQFGEQEPGEINEIVSHMQKEYGVEFPMFNKINVIGSEASPAFKNLIEQSSVVPDWNFYKYLVNEDGEVLNAWGTLTTIEEIYDEIEAAVNKAKKKKKEAGLTDSKVSPEVAFEEKPAKVEL